MFGEHNLKVGDKVRVSGIAKHDFEFATRLLHDGDVTEVIETGMFLGMMPTVTVKATRNDDGAAFITGGRVPFATTDFSILTKIEEEL